MPSTKIFGESQSHYARSFVKGKKDKYEMWFKSESRGKLSHVTYAAVHDQAGEFQGVLEYVQDIQPYREIDTDFFRGLE